MHSDPLIDEPTSLRSGDGVSGTVFRGRRRLDGQREMDDATAELADACLGRWATKLATIGSAARPSRTFCHLSRLLWVESLEYGCFGLWYEEHKEPMDGRSGDVA